MVIATAEAGFPSLYVSVDRVLCVGAGGVGTGGELCPFFPPQSLSLEKDALALWWVSRQRFYVDLLRAAMKSTGIVVQLY